MQKNDSLISRKALIEELRKLQDDFDSNTSKTTIIAAISKVMNAPEVDVEKHGHWMRYNPFEGIFLKCSVCEKCGSASDKYCPNCGAKMYGERKER